MNTESLERATLDAVAPLEIGTMPGWLLPFDTSTVGRAISAVPIAHAGVNPDAVPTIEALYAVRGLRAQFRVADISGLTAVHDRLRQLGYAPLKPTLTLVGDVDTWPTATPNLAVQLTDAPSDAWMSVYLSGDFDPIDGANRVRAFSRSKHLVHASLCDQDGVVAAAGTAAFSHGWSSLHGLRTIARQRGKGFASALIAALGNEARAKGLKQCFLQVEEENAPAIRLYRGLGFQTAWRYHYWCKPVQAAS